MPRRFLATVSLVALLSLAFAACSDDNGEAPAATEAPAEATQTPVEGAISAGLSEWEIALSQPVAPRGSVTFVVANEGGIVHDLVVLKTDLPPAELPIDPAIFAVDTDADGVELIGLTDELGVAGTETLTLEMEAGSYVLICNIPTHYDNKMFMSFIVE